MYFFLNSLLTLMQLSGKTSKINSKMVRISKTNYEKSYFRHKYSKEMYLTTKPLKTVFSVQ